MAGSTSVAPRFTKKQVAILNALCHANKNQRQALLRTADKSIVTGICEIALNVLKGNIELKDSAKKRLKKHKSILRKLIHVKKNKRNVWKHKKKAILQHGGSFLPLLIAPIISALATKIFATITEN